MVEKAFHMARQTRVLFLSSQVNHHQQSWFVDVASGQGSCSFPCSWRITDIPLMTSL